MGGRKGVAMGKVHTYVQATISTDNITREKLVRLYGSVAETVRRAATPATISIHFDCPNRPGLTGMWKRLASGKFRKEEVND